jgi:hypothetical protein
VSEYETTSELNEVIHYERLDADMEQAALEAEGNAHARRERRVDKLLGDGDVEAAIRLCAHGYVGGLTGSCTDGDPRHGEEGYRCFNCGAVVDEIGGSILHAR